MASFISLPPNSGLEDLFNFFDEGTLEIAPGSACELRFAQFQSKSYTLFVITYFNVKQLQ